MLIIRGLSHIALSCPGGSVVKNMPAQCKKGQRDRFNPWVGGRDPLEEELSASFLPLKWEMYMIRDGILFSGYYGMQDLQAEAPYHSSSED